MNKRGIQETINELHRMKKRLTGAQGCSVHHEEANAYSAMCLRIAIFSLEKQIPKKPVKHNINTTWNYDCECGWRLISKINSEWIAGTKAWFCPKCGQAIEWEGEDE